MKVVGYWQAGNLDQGPWLFDLDAPRPQPGCRDLLVKVLAVAVNPVDIKIHRNRSADGDAPVVLGWDCVGEVESIGSGVELFKPGDVVWYAGDVSRPGCYAEYHLVNEQIAGHAPKHLSAAQAAALPLTGITAWELLFDRLELPQDGSAQDARILVVGAAGGVGSILVQLASKLTGALVIATASRADSSAWVQKCGADIVVNHHGGIEQSLKEAGLNDVTHVISLTHTSEHFSELVNLLRPQGKLALIDDPILPLDVNLMKRKSLSLHWEFMFTRPLFSTSDLIRQHHILNDLAVCADSSVIHSTVRDHYGSINAENLTRAHLHLASQKAIGKVVLEGF